MDICEIWCEVVCWIEHAQHRIIYQRNCEHGKFSGWLRKILDYINNYRRLTNILKLVVSLVTKRWKVKGKVIPVRGRGDPQGCETSRLPHSLDNWLTEEVRLSALRAGRLLPSRKIPGTNFVRGWIDRRAIVRLEGSGKLKNIHLIGTRSCSIPPSSIVPQKTELPRSPEKEMEVTKI
jgi:hypothetical protein